jgi:electron transfer flavoprotein alpha subunit
MTVLVIAEHDNIVLKGATLNAVTAAAQCSGDIHVLVIGHACGAVAEQAGRIAGVSQVLLADAPHLAHGLAENVAAQTLQAIGQGTYSHVLAAATAYGRNIMPRVAAMLDAGQISEVTNVLAADTFERPIYAGNAIATVQSLDPIKVLTVRSVAFAAAATGGNAAEIRSLAPVADSGLSQFVSLARADSLRPELTSARVVVSGGRGLGSADHFKMLEPLADILGGAVGASRAAVDAGFVPNDLQVGQTGKIVAPELYVAIGISGAIQHLAGMSDSKVIVAINKDAEAPIFSVADYGIVGDLFEIVPALIDALQEEQKRLAA